METSKPVEKVSRYEITGELGKGAMGRVYKAVDPTIGRTVALKTMRLDVHGLETDEMLRRFKNEARLAGVLNHGNIVTIYDAGEQDGLFYIAMEYIEGITLHGVLNERKTLSPEEIINISKQICAGLDHAHHHGVIHRDVKPANIMLEPDGTAKIMDFGIAKSGGGLTSTGQVLGTPNYMAPEQVRGHALDGRTDLFSFGVMLYEMTTGEKPFAGNNVTTIIYKIIHENPTPPRELDVTIHPGLDKVIMKALAKKPEERYQTGAELARELQNYKSLGANTDSTQEIPSSSFPAATGAAPSPAQAKPSAKSAAPVAVAGSTPKPRKMQPPPPSMKKIWIGVAIFVALVALASVGVWKGTITRDHSADNPPVITAPPVAATQPVPVETAPAPAPEVPVKGKAKRASAAAVVPAVKKSQATSVADQPSTQNSGTGDLKITSTPDGAAVQIDGRSDPSMSTPYNALRLAPGPHDITLIKSGYLDEKRVISVAAGRTDFVSVTMQKAPMATSQVTFNSDPGGAEIWVDGKSIGRVTPAQAVIVAGQHQIVLRKPGYEDSTNPVTLVAGQPFSLSNNLKSLTPASSGSPFGKFKKIFGGSSAEENVNLTINSTPAGAAISVNGKDIGQQTPFTLPLAPGKYDIGLTLAGHQTVRKSIKIEKNKPAEINEALPAQ